jgi:hypothetical protein
MTHQGGSFRLHIESCRREPNRYAWVILDHEHIVRQSCHSLPSEQEARRRGRAELKDVEALWRDSR